MNSNNDLITFIHSEKFIDFINYVYCHNTTASEENLKILQFLKENENLKILQFLKENNIDTENIININLYGTILVIRCPYFIRILGLISYDRLNITKSPF